MPSTNEQELFDKIRDLINDLPLINQMILSAYQEDNKITLKLPQNESPFKTYDFFRALKYNYVYFQDGEQLMYDHININEIFFAFDKTNSVGTNFDGTQIYLLYICKPV